MVVHILLRKLEQCLGIVEAENRYLRAIITQRETTIKRQAQTRKSGRTSKTAKGAKRRSTILSVLRTLKRCLENFSIAKLLKVAFEAYHRKGSFFNIVTPKNQKMNA